MPLNPVQPFDSEEIEYFFDHWCSLLWSPWVSFSATKEEFRQIPKGPGVYRVRPVNKDFLMYIGETSRTVFERLNELRKNLKRADLMPWNDPHTAAPSLWAWNNAEHYEYECSAAPIDATTSGRRGIESFLLYKYRQERRESTLCNFGRFHPRYCKSRNKKDNLRGKKLADGAPDNSAGGPSIAPLEVIGKPGASDWMGLKWTARASLTSDKVRQVEAGPGLYLLTDAESHDIVYIGQSAQVAKRLVNHSRKTWDGKTLQFSYQIIGPSVVPHNLKELENDLLGNYFENYRKTPEFQFRHSR
jgi:hypothetical protein